MSPEQINQIIETIKTLNLNIDSQTAVKIVSELKTLFWFLAIKDFLSGLVVVAGVVTAIYFITRAIFQYWKKQEEEW